MSNREQIIQDKEKKVYDLKKRNQELEKYKFVLDYRIKELKQKIEPREKQISEMVLQVKVTHFQPREKSSNQVENEHVT